MIKYLIVLFFIFLFTPVIQGQVRIKKQSDEGSWYVIKDSDQDSTDFFRIRKLDQIDSSYSNVFDLAILKKGRVKSNFNFDKSLAFYFDYYGEFYHGNYYKISKIISIYQGLMNFKIHRINNSGYLSKTLKSNVPYLGEEVVFNLSNVSLKQVEANNDYIYYTPEFFSSDKSAIFKTDNNLNLKKFVFYKFENFALGHHLIKEKNNNIYNIYTPKNEDGSPRYAVIFKLDTNLNITKTIQINNIRQPNIDFLPDGRLLISGFNTILNTASYIMTDVNFNYSEEWRNNFIERGDSSLNYRDRAHSLVNRNGDIFFRITQRTNTILVKYDKNFNLLWKKVFPFYARIWLDNKGGAFFSKSIQGETEIYTIDANGITDPPLDDYCGDPLIKSDFYKDKILPFTAYKVIEDAELWEESSEFYPSIDTVIITDTAFFTVTHPEPDFLDKPFCAISCDTLHAMDIGIIDSGYYVGSGIKNDSILCPPVPGMMNVTRYITYYGGCIDSITKTIEALNPPYLFTTDSVTLCFSGMQTQIHAETDVSSTLKWYDGSSENDKIITKPGIYTVTATRGVCTISADISVELLQEAYPDWPKIISSTDEQPCLDSSVTLSINDDFQGQFKWQDGNTDKTYIVDNSGYVYIDGSLRGCNTRDSVLIQFKDCRQSAVYMPNVFSPNEDGVNDYFLPNYLNATILEMSVYDRWGSQMYHSAPFDDKGWDGSFKNQEMMPGVYVWWLRYRDNLNGREEVRKGSVQLFR